MNGRFSRVALAATVYCLDVSVQSARRQFTSGQMQRRLMTDLELSVGRVLSIPDLPSPEVLFDSASPLPDPLAFGLRLTPPHHSRDWPEPIREQMRAIGLPRDVSPLPMSLHEWMASIARSGRREKAGRSDSDNSDAASVQAN